MLLRRPQALSKLVSQTSPSIALQRQMVVYLARDSSLEQWCTGVVSLPRDQASHDKGDEEQGACGARKCRCRPSWTARTAEEQSSEMERVDIVTALYHHYFCWSEVHYKLGQRTLLLPLLSPILYTPYSLRLVLSCAFVFPFFALLGRFYAYCPVYRACFAPKVCLGDILSDMLMFARYNVT